MCVNKMVDVNKLMCVNKVNGQEQEIEAVNG